MLVTVLDGIAEVVTVEKSVEGSTIEMVAGELVETKMSVMKVTVESVSMEMLIEVVTTVRRSATDKM